MTPPAEKKKRPGLFFLVGCAGCAFLLLLVGVGGTMGWLLWNDSRTHEARAPVAWRDSIRTIYRLPDALARLAPPTTDSGDALALLRTARFGDVGGPRMRAVRRLIGGGGLSAEDSAQILGSVRDSAAVVASSAARRSRYEPATLPDSGPTLLEPLGRGLRLLATGEAGRAADVLMLRGEARRWRGDLAGAKQDFAAVVGLGRLVWFGDIGAVGGGRRMMRMGAIGLARVAAQTGDRALAAAADTVRSWGSGSFGLFNLIGPLPPDSLLLVAQDTTLPRGARAWAIENACWGSVFRPIYRLLTGPSRFIMAGTRELTHDPDPVVARVAVMADSTLARLDNMGIRNRYRVAAGKSVR